MDICKLNINNKSIVRVSHLLREQIAARGQRHDGIVIGVHTSRRQEDHLGRHGQVCLDLSMCHGFVATNLILI